MSRTLDTSVLEGLTCSAAALDVPLPGTATRVTGWLCVEHPGAWGRDVIGDEVLGPEITAALAVRAAAAGVRPTLIRRPGRHEFTGTRTVYLASSRPRDSWCERLEITDLRELLDLDLGVVAGPPPGVGVLVTEPVALVCAHGKRDQCCALLGRPIAAGLAPRHPGRVWECSHTGGHRFAPALVLLPTGMTYGRLDAASADEVLEAAGRGMVAPTGLRGRSCYTPVEQAAEIAVRELLEPTPVGDLTVLGVSGDPVPTRDSSSPDRAFLGGSRDDSNRVAGQDDPVAGIAEVTHRDGRRWRVVVRTTAFAPRQASCGAGPKPVTALVADPPRPLVSSR